MGTNESKKAALRAVELCLNDKQKLVSLLYLAKCVSAAQLLAALDGCEEMSLLRLEESKTR